MLIPRRVFALASAVAISTVSAVSAADSTPAIDGWFDCSAVTFANEVPDSTGSGSSSANLLNGFPVAECATFKAPLCHDGVCKEPSDTQIDIFVKRIPAVASGKPNIFFMQGGPGAASPAMESAMTGVYSILKGNVNVYTMDHRGTGRSTKLDCVAAQAMTSASPGGTSIDASEVASCAADIENKYGSDRSSFSVTSAASDLKYFITNFLADQTTFVYGVSYGTTLVERLMHLNTTGIAGYVLDGISTSSGSDKANFEYFSTWDVDYDEVAQYYISYCAKHTDECGKYFKDTPLPDALKALMANLDDTTSTYKCYKPLDAMLSKLNKYDEGTVAVGSSLRSFLGTLFADATMRNFIPVITYRATRCNSDDVKVLTHFFNKYIADNSGDSASEDDAFESNLLYQMIVYSELWEMPTPSYDTMLARYMKTTVSSGSADAVHTYCLFSKEDSKTCAKYANEQSYNASALIYPRDQYWNVAAQPPSDVSVMLMSSKMDPQTPHKYAEFLYKALDTDNKDLIVFDQATHGTLWSTPVSNNDPDAKICGMQVVASYVANLGDLKKMDKSCVAQMPEVTLALPDTMVRNWLNTSSAIDGKFTGTSTQVSDGASSSSDSAKSYKTVFIVFLALFVLAVVSTAVFLFKWRAAKKRSALATHGAMGLNTPV